MTLLRITLLAPLLFLLASRSPAGAASCRYVLGFATLHDLIPDTVGDCLVDEHHRAESGDGLQETARGLLVWRKADNETAFTDGYRTWVNGPFGLQERLNTQRFAWEANPEGLPIVGVTAPGSLVPDRCSAGRGKPSPLCPPA